MSSPIFTGMARDKSITSLTGASQTVCALNGNRQFLAIENTGNANIGVNFVGTAATPGTALIGGTGTLTLVPGGSILFQVYVPQNPVTVIGTAGQTVAVIEG